MQIKGIQHVALEVTEKTLAEALQDYMLTEYLEDVDQQVGESTRWYTEEDGYGVYLDDEYNLVVIDEEVAAIVNTINILKYGAIKRI